MSVAVVSVAVSHIFHPFHSTTLIAPLYLLYIAVSCIDACKRHTVPLAYNQLVLLTPFTIPYDFPIHPVLHLEPYA